MQGYQHIITITITITITIIIIIIITITITIIIAVTITITISINLATGIVITGADNPRNGFDADSPRNGLVLTTHEYGFGADNPQTYHDLSDGTLPTVNLHNFQNVRGEIMTSLVILCFVSVVLLIGATPCKDGQHCAVCDERGDCSSTCHPGYFNKRCTSTCNSGCRYKACELLKGSGIAVCIHGCNPGFQGTSCNIPCEHQRQCTKCKGGCDGDYCQIGSACVSGCVDSYYGLDCKNCSERCKSCNRSTGMCEQCHSPYTVPNCEMPCENCKGTCKAGCEGGCNPGFYGHWCEKVCSENCRAGLDATFVLESCDRNVSTNCTPECDKTTGYCIHGCNTGWHGTNCSSRCNSKCANLSCTESGVCVDGCAPGYAGTDCTCYENCFDLVCYSENGTCAKGCDKGYYGAFCNHSCQICIDGICDKVFGTCIKGCNITDHECQSTCSSDCSIDICRNESTCGVQPEVHSNYIIIGLTTVLCLVIILLASCMCLRKYSSTGRTNQADHYLEAYQPASMYWEIADEDVNLEGQPLDTEANDEQLREVQDREADVASDGPSKDSLSYSHLVRDFFVDEN
ncbi:cell death abnormality protein 1-like [Haliotis cracherodii]|uniref:cell death abnormality protein 1-like n=1 Tax=Haliotis cracherodii TaxID=6455 RepID=UPI0039EBF8D3